MKIAQGILVVAGLAVCWQASAETPQIAYGVTIVGAPSTCAGGVGLRCTNLSTHPYVLLGGYFGQADGGGGYFALAPGASCTDNGGTILKDSNQDCFYRMDDRAAIPVKWFGAKCDATTSVWGGSVASGSKAFTSTAPGVAFQPGDVGKTIELNYQSANPFVTTISGYTSSTQVTLSTAAPTAYPGQVGATSVNFSPIQQDGLDLPGAGYKPRDVLSVACTSCGASTPAQITVRATSLVGFGSTGGGTGYAVGDSIYFAALPAASYATVSAAEIQVQSVNGAGAVTGYVFVGNGDFRPISSSTTTNPQTFAISTSGSGSGFSASLAPGDASFGVAEVLTNPTVAGQYSSFPPIPSATSDSGTGTGATIDLAFPTPTWTYASDDTAALQALETWMENDYDRGIYKAGEVPDGHTCLLQTLTIARPVTWRSSGSRQAQLMQIMGSQGSTVDNTNWAFVLVAINHSSSDPYQDLSVGLTTVGFNNISVIGGTNSQTVLVNSTPTSYTNDGLLFTNGTASGIAAALENLQVANFPGHALAAYGFAGELRGYDVVARGSGGNCVDLEYTDNPYRFYGLRASGCNNGIGINLKGTQSEEFHGVSVFGNLIDVSLSGTRPKAEAYVLFDGAQFQGSTQENMYLDQQNETLICAANCVFEDAWQTPCPNQNPPSCGAIEIGPHARTSATGNAPVIAQFNQGLFYSSPPYDVVFDTNAKGNYCNCRVALGSGMVDVATQGGNPGQPTTNLPAQLIGQTTYAPPTFANAASVGIPLTLNPNELGVGVSTDTVAGPGKGGLKLRVECGTKTGTAKIVALAGNSPTETVVVDNIGGAVGGSCGN